MRDFTTVPTVPGVYVNRVVRDTHSAPVGGDYVYTEKVASSMAELAENTGIDISELYRWWFETHNEGLIVME